MWLWFSACSCVFLLGPMSYCGLGVGTLLELLFSMKWVNYLLVFSLDIKAISLTGEKVENGMRPLSCLRHSRLRYLLQYSPVMMRVGLVILLILAMVSTLYICEFIVINKFSLLTSVSDTDRGGITFSTVAPVKEIGCNNVRQGGFRGVVLCLSYVLRVVSLGFVSYESCRPLFRIPSLRSFRNESNNTQSKRIQSGRDK